MVFVVERYLPGLPSRDLLRGLSRLEREEASAVRYLGSTVVLEDEACFCEFEGPTEAAVAEANRRAGLTFDRIVSAVNVRPERSTTMNVSATIPQTVQIGRGRLLGLLAGVAVVAAAVTWALVAFIASGRDTYMQRSPAASPALTSVEAKKALQDEVALGYGSGLAELGSMLRAQEQLTIGYASGLAAIGNMQRVQEELAAGYGRGLAAIGKMQRDSFARQDR
jgi:hypothetical protein